MTSMWSLEKMWSGAVGLLVVTVAGSALAAPTHAGTVKGKGSGDATRNAAGESLVSHREPALLGIGVGFFTESSEFREESFIGGQQTRDIEPREYESDGIYNVHAWYLTPIWFEGLRWGGGVSWFNQYSLVEPDAEDDDEPFVLGQMFQLGLQTEYELSNVVSSLNVIVGLRGGGSLLFPGGELRDRIDGLEQRGFDTWSSPQFGVYLAPLAGVRWPLSRRVSLRADISAQFAKLWLYSAEGEASGITSEASATLGTTRTQLLLGLDFAL